MTPQVNLSQSQFQDTFFVAGAQLTPFRRLRQIELELRSITDSIKRAQFNMRRLEVKIKKLDPEDEEQLIDIEEAKWDMEQQTQLYIDAVRRQLNFEKLKSDLLASVPREYWEQGYEAAEAEYWPAYFSKQISMALAMGLPPPQQAMEQVLLLPPELQKKTILLSQEKAKALQLEYGPPST